MDIPSQFMYSVSEKGLTPSHIKECETAMGTPFALTRCGLRGRQRCQLVGYGILEYKQAAVITIWGQLTYNIFFFKEGSTISIEESTISKEGRMNSKFWGKNKKS